MGDGSNANQSTYVEIVFAQLNHPQCICRVAQILKHPHTN